MEAETEGCGGSCNLLSVYYMLDILFMYLIESVQQFLGKYLILQMKKQKFIHKLSILSKVKLVSSIWNWALFKIHRFLCKHKVNGRVNSKLYTTVLCICVCIFKHLLPGLETEDMGNIVLKLVLNNGFCLMELQISMCFLQIHLHEPIFDNFTICHSRHPSHLEGFTKYSAKI